MADTAAPGSIRGPEARQRLAPQALARPMGWAVVGELASDEVHGPVGAYRLAGRATDRSARNICMMHTLERVAGTFNDAGVPLLALKGAALNLTLYQGPEERPMLDLDLLIKPEHADRAFDRLETLGGLRGDPLVREDFFPRFHYETEYVVGAIFPVRIDLHVRPFRPLRYSQLVPADALWQRAESVHIGEATLLVPCAEDMLVHLAAHASIHGNARPLWLRDIRRWVDARRNEINWDRFLSTVEAWHLALPVREGIKHVERELGRVVPPGISRHLSLMRANWPDRLALWQAPRDAQHPIAHVVVNVSCTPGWRFCLAYLLAVLIPDRGHMAEWYCRRHWAWLPCAHLVRWLWPIIGRIRRVWTRFSKIETRESPIHGTGVFATRQIKAGELIARYRGKAVDHDGQYVMQHKNASGKIQRYEITGKLRFLNHSCRPKARLSGFELIALEPIRAGQEITIDYGQDACSCRRIVKQTEEPSPPDAPVSAT